MAEELSAKAKRLRDKVRRKALGTFDLARAKLEEMLRTGESMNSDEEVRACLAMMRLAPHLLTDRKGSAPPEEPKLRAPLFDEDHWTPERLRALEMLDYYSNASPEEMAEIEAREKAAYDAWLAKRPGPFKSGEEATEYYRTHEIDNISDLWDRIEAQEYALFQAKRAKGGDHE